MNQSLVSFMVAVTNIASPVFLIILSLILYFFLIWKRRGYYDIVFIFSMISALVLEIAIKYYLNVPRPENSMIEVFGPSFPSGHATMATVFFLVLAYAFRDDIKNLALKYFFEFFCFAMIVLICFSRIYLGAHRINEVVAGFFLGTVCVVLTLVFVRKPRANL